MSNFGTVLSFLNIIANNWETLTCIDSTHIELTDEKTRCLLDTHAFSIDWTFLEQNKQYRISDVRTIAKRFIYTNIWGNKNGN